MARLATWILLGLFTLSTAPMGVDGADPCNDCGEPEEEAPASQSSCCGDCDDAREASSQPHQDFHCCCVHTHALFMTGAPEEFSPAAAGRISVPIHQAFLEPSLRQTFHIPIA